MIVRRLAGFALVVFALLAAPVPPAVGQAQPRPDPRELWQQFPLDTGRPNPQAPAERESTPPASAPTPGGTAEEGQDGPLPSVEIAAIVLALLLTTGALAYAGRGAFELGTHRRRRRAFQEFVDAPRQPETGGEGRTEPSGKRTVRMPRLARRRAERAAAAKSVVGIVSEVEALRAKLEVGAGPKKTETPAHDRVKRVKKRFPMYFTSANNNQRTANDEVESLKAKLDVHRAPAKSESIPHDERERLKEKLGMQPAYTESASRDEVQTLKEKLGKQAAAPKGVSTTHEELETLKAKLAKQAALANAERETADEAALKEKLNGAGAAAKRETTVRARLETQLVDHGPRPTSERKVDLHADTPSPKLDVSNRPAKDRARASVAVDALDTTVREPRGERAAAATPVAPRPVSAATRRSTIAELVYEHRSDLTAIGIVLIVLALLLFNIAVLFGIGVAS
jgi:hypothetical protein